MEISDNSGGRGNPEAEVMMDGEGADLDYDYSNFWDEGEMSLDEIENFLLEYNKNKVIDCSHLDARSREHNDLLMRSVKRMNTVRNDPAFQADIWAFCLYQHVLNTQYVSERKNKKGGKAREKKKKKQNKNKKNREKWFKKHWF